MLASARSAADAGAQRDRVFVQLLRGAIRGALEPGELTRAFGRFGLLSRTDWLAEDVAGEFTHGDVRLQALGEAGVLVTPAAVAMAYTRLAVASARAWMAPVLGGMEDAVEFGTAQRARVAGLKVAGKTGSVRARMEHI